ncbi:hypothetical protein, partial [Bacillus sp. WP8]|uniref:hypothetical protein n=1 Tax=Bacillus sp. WP8 TaxID=756828 RepID=UPI0037BF364E
QLQSFHLQPQNRIILIHLHASNPTFPYTQPSHFLFHLTLTSNIINPPRHFNKTPPSFPIFQTSRPNDPFSPLS